MTSQLQNRVAVVTGASGGLGRRVVARLSRHGAPVALVARSAKAIEDLATTIREEGGTALAIATDVSNTEAVAELKTKVECELGKPSILVNAVGVFGPIQRIQHCPSERWIQTLLINTVGPFLTCRAFLNGMLESGWGRIINFSSAAAFHAPGPLNSAYATSKVAINQFTRHLAAEIVGTGVTANVIHPGDVKTEMWAFIRDEVHRLGPDAHAFREWVEWVDRTGGDDPERAADLVLKLVSDDAASVNGRFIWIEGGLQPPVASWGSGSTDQPWKET